MTTILSALLAYFVATWRWFRTATRPAACYRSRRPDLQSLPDKILPAVAIWTGDGDNRTWNDEENWDTVLVPTLNDDVYITEAAAQVRIDTDVTIRSLTLDTDDGSLDGLANLTTTEFTWKSGELGWSGELRVSGAASIEGGDGRLTLFGRQLHLSGHTTWSSGIIELGSGAQIVNDGLFQALGEASLLTYYSDPHGDETFTNNGLFQRLGGSPGNDMLGIFCGFENIRAVPNAGPPGTVVQNPYGAGGSVSALAGTIVFVTDTETVNTSTGAYGAAAGAAIIFEGGTFRMDGVTFSGDGLISLTGTVQIPAGATVTNSGNFKLDFGGTIIGEGVQANQGTFRNASGNFEWVDGTLEALRFTNSLGATVTIAGGEVGDAILDSSLFTNYGHMLWTSGTIIVSHTTDNAAINNLGDFEIACDEDMQDGGGQQGFSGILINNTDPDRAFYGVIRKTNGCVTCAGGALDPATNIYIAVDNFFLIKKGGFNINFVGGIDNHGVGVVTPG